MTTSQFGDRSSADPYRPLAGHQAITPTVATALTVPSTALMAVVTCETQPVRWRDDGTDVTASTGHLLAVGGVLVIVGTVQLQAIKFIDTAVGASTLRVSYYA